MLLSDYPFSICHVSTVGLQVPARTQDFLFGSQGLTRDASLERSIFPTQCSFFISFNFLKTRRNPVLLTSASRELGFQAHVTMPRQKYFTIKVVPLERGQKQICTASERHEGLTTTGVPHEVRNVT